MDKPCNQCHESKPLEDFSPNGTAPDGRRSRCRTCRAETARLKRLERAGRPVPLPSRYLAPYNHVRRLFREVDKAILSGTAPLPLDVPVKVRGRGIASPRSCAIKLVNGVAWLYIASQRGALQLQYASTAPEALIYALEGLGLELILPGEAILASDHKGLA